MTNQNIPAPAISAMENHQAAKAEYLQHLERLTILAERTDRYQKTAAAALEQAHGDGQKWREQLRKNDGELTKEIQKLRQDALAAEQLANEYQLMADEVELEQEMARFDIEPVRKGYQVACTEARRAYARALQAEALKTLLNTDEGREFFRVFAVTGLILPAGRITLTGPACIPPAGTEELCIQDLGGRILEILDECAASLPCYAKESEAWQELALLPASQVEGFPRGLAESPIRKKQRKAEIDAIRQQKSA